MTAMGAIPLTFRADREFVEQTDELARAKGLSRSDYVRQAVVEKNHRVMAERIAQLSRVLSADHARINAEMDSAARDGLANR